MTEIIKVVVNGKEKAIEVKDGLVLVICGTGPDAGAFYKKIEDCSNADFAAAKEKEVSEEEKIYSFDEAVNFICNGSAVDLLTAVKYARAHGNKFHSLIKELSNVVNADDAYCSALIKISRPLGEDVENTIFCLFKEAVDNNNKKAEENFIRIWDSLKTITTLCGSFNDCV